MYLHNKKKKFQIVVQLSDIIIQVVAHVFWPTVQLLITNCGEQCYFLQSINLSSYKQSINSNQFQP